MTRRTGNLTPRKLFITFQMLPAMRTIEFKLAHRVIATGSLIMNGNREIVQLLFSFHGLGGKFDVLVIVHKAIIGGIPKN